MNIKASMIKVKKLEESAQIPKYNNPTDAGADLFSIENVCIEAKNRKTIRTGISMEIPCGLYGRVAPRSGLATKHGLDTLAGVVDSGYRGEIKVILYNTSHEDYIVSVGDKIAQIIFEKYQTGIFEESEELEDSSRGEKGFNSSGK